MVYPNKLVLKVSNRLHEPTPGITGWHLYNAFVAFWLLMLPFHALLF